MAGYHGGMIKAISADVVTDSGCTWSGALCAPITLSPAVKSVTFRRYVDN